MGNNKKTRIYFDYNIYEDYAKGKIHLDLEELKKKYSVYQSVAMIEEYYKAERNCNIENRRNLNNTKLAFDSINYEKHILIPGETRINCESDTFENRYSIIKNNDTQDYIAESAIHNVSLYKQYAEETKEKNPNVKNYTNINYDEIWNQKEVCERLEEFRNILKEHNSECQIQLTQFYGIHARKDIIRLKKNDFSLKKGMFARQEHPNMLRLQTTIELLSEILQECGYNSDKRKNAISGVYDTSHIIYATYCNYFVTNDSRLAKRAKAIYYYLGINTNVVSFDEFISLYEAISGV